MKKERGFVKAKLILRGVCFFTHPRYTSIKKYLGINRVNLITGFKGISENILLTLGLNRKVLFLTTLPIFFFKRMQL